MNFGKTPLHTKAYVLLWSNGKCDPTYNMHMQMYAVTKEAWGKAEIIKSVLPLATAGASVGCYLLRSALLLVIVQILTQCYIGIWCWTSLWWNAWDGTFWCFKPCSILRIKNIFLEPATWDRSDTVVFFFTKMILLYMPLMSECTHHSQLADMVLEQLAFHWQTNGTWVAKWGTLENVTKFADCDNLSC